MRTVQSLITPSGCLNQGNHLTRDPLGLHPRQDPHPRARQESRCHCQTRLPRLPKLLRRPPKPRKPKGVKTGPLPCLAVDTIWRAWDGIRRSTLTFIDPVRLLRLCLGHPRQIHPSHPSGPG